MKKFLVVGLLIVILVMFSGCEQIFREGKDLVSGFTGLNRIVTVYGIDGTLIKTYEGKLDVETNEYGNKVKFELNGKRVIIYNAIVIVDEN